jgi:hypothetical protein
MAAIPESPSRFRAFSKSCGGHFRFLRAQHRRGRDKQHVMRVVLAPPIGTPLLRGFRFCESADPSLGPNWESPDSYTDAARLSGPASQRV